MTSEDKELQAQITKDIQEIIPEHNPEMFKGIHVTPQEILFCYNFVESNDAVESYKRAYGCDHKMALSKGRTLANKSNIVEACKILRDEIWERAQSVLPLKLLQGIQEIQDLDVLDYYEADGRARMLDSIPQAKRRLIENVSFTVNNKTGGVILSYTLPSKNKVSALLMELLKIRAETTKGAEDTVNDAETRRMVESIFGGKKE